MKLIRQNFLKDGAGFVTLIAEDGEDMYTLYNLIAVNDNLRTSTVRNVVREKANGATSKDRIVMNLTLEIETIEFDPEKCSLRVKGRNTEENEHVKKGQYHTLEVELNRQFTLEKTYWDSMFRDTLKIACDPVRGSEIAAVVMQEGLAHVCLITPSMTLTMARIEKKIVKKGGAAKNTSHDTGRISFFKDIYDAINKHIDMDAMKVIIIGGLDVTRSDFINFMKKNSESLQDVNIIRNLKKILQAHASSGHKHAIDEILGKDEVQSRLSDLKATGEVLALKKFNEKLSKDSDWACYGYNHVHYADVLLLIDELLIIDSLFQSADFNKRRQYVSLVESVREHGGKVYLFSNLHVSGQKLNLYSGIAAVLRAPLAEYELPETFSNQSDTNVFRVPSYSGQQNVGDYDDDDDDDEVDERTQDEMRSLGLLL